jgi:acyl-coenzyme A synthetase/AMP-(fatty) acid ligase
VRADLPHTATGKIQRFKLRDEDVTSPGVRREVDPPKL